MARRWAATAPTRSRRPGCPEPPTTPRLSRSAPVRYRARQHKDQPWPTRPTPRTPPKRPRPPFPTPSLEDIQHWTWVMGRAQQMMMEHLAAQMGEAAETAAERRPKAPAIAWPGMNMFGDPAKIDGGAGARCGARGSTSGSGHWAAWRRAASGARSPRRPTRTSRFAAPGMAREPALRHDPADLSAGLRAAAGLGRCDRGGGRGDARARCGS